MFWWIKTNLTRSVCSDAMNDLWNKHDIVSGILICINCPSLLCCCITALATWYKLAVLVIKCLHVQARLYLTEFCISLAEIIICVELSLAGCIFHRRDSYKLQQQVAGASLCPTFLLGTVSGWPVNTIYVDLCMPLQSVLVLCPAALTTEWHVTAAHLSFKDFHWLQMSIIILNYYFGWSAGGSY